MSFTNSLLVYLLRVPPPPPLTHLGKPQQPPCRGSRDVCSLRCELWCAQPFVHHRLWQQPAVKGHAAAYQRAAMPQLLHQAAHLHEQQCAQPPPAADSCRQGEPAGPAARVAAGHDPGGPSCAGTSTGQPPQPATTAKGRTPGTPDRNHQAPGLIRGVGSPYRGAVIHPAHSAVAARCPRACDHPPIGPV